MNIFDRSRIVLCKASNFIDFAESFTNNPNKFIRGAQDKTIMFIAQKLHLITKTDLLKYIKHQKSKYHNGNDAFEKGYKAALYDLLVNFGEDEKLWQIRE